RLLFGLQAFPLSETDRVLQCASCAFDTSILETFMPLLSGARLILARPEGQRDLAYLASLIAEQGITVMEIVPILLRALVEEPGFGPCLRRVVCGGDVLSPSLQRRFFSRSKADLLNSYGPTETTIDVTHWKCVRQEEGRTEGSVPIGLPNVNTEIYLLDAGLEPVPTGQTGEIVVGGACVARGYHG